MLTVDGIPKKKKQSRIWQRVRKDHSLLTLMRLFRDAVRSV
jgi:hypothetical protein